MLRFSTLLIVFSCLSNLDAQLLREDIHLILERQTNHQYKYADIDGDGDIDIIGSRQGYDGHLFTYLNDGSGNFGLARIFGDTYWIGNPSSVLNFELADIDQDSDLDIIPATIAAAVQPFFRNDGDGNFTPQSENLSFENQISDYHLYQTGDLDQDGQVDIVQLNAQNSTIILYRRESATGDYAGSVVSNPNPDYPPGGGAIRDFFLSDFNLDGKLDFGFIASSTQSPSYSSHLYLYEQTCDLCFEELASITLSTSTSFNWLASSICTDLNNDSYPDLVVTVGPSPGVAETVVLRNNPLTSSFTIMTRFDEVGDCAVYDQNQDEYPDLFISKTEDQPQTDFLGSSYYYLENSSNFTFAQHLISTQFTGHEVRVEDLDQNGLGDLITNFRDGLQPGHLSVRMANTPLSYAEPLSINTTVNSIAKIYSEDWGTDQDQDLLLLGKGLDDGYDKDAIFSIENYAGFLGAVQPERYSKGLINHSAFVDIDQDGSKDLLTLETLPDRSEAELLWYRQIDLGSFTNGTTIPVPFDINWRTCVVADWDNDNDPDILLSATNRRIYIAINDLMVSGEWLLIDTESFLPGSSTNYSQLNTVDIDQDGQNDLILRRSTDLWYSLRENDGPGFSFWSSYSFPEDHLLGSFNIADFNQDGRPDLLTMLRNNTENRLVQAIGFGNGEGFDLPVLVQPLSGTGYSHLSVQDLNEDGRPDLMSSRGFQINRNNGAHFTSPYWPEPVAGATNNQQIRFVQAATKSDLNSDGKTEIVSGSNELLAYELDFLRTSILEGSIRWDTSGQCINSTQNRGLSWNISVNDAEQEQLLIANEQGLFNALLPQYDVYQVKPLPPSGYWQVCPPDTLIQVTDSSTVHQSYFTASALVDCPLLRISLSGSSISQCFPSSVSIRYENLGTIAMDSAFIVLNHDSRLEVITSTPIWTTSTDSTLSFVVLDVGVGESGTVEIQFEPSCTDLVLGESLCFWAEASPQISCQDPNLNWDGAELQASVICTPDGSAFQITNKGEQATSEPHHYRISGIVNDDIILYLDDVILLEPGETDTITPPLVYDRWLLEMEQVSGHPSPEMIRLTNGECLGTELHLDSLQTQLLNSDGNPYTANLCRPVIGPFDPNDKSALPTGWSDAHYIERAWSIDYTIEFQNVGTDFAQTVILEDELSTALDLSSFQPLGASHNYQYNIVDGNLLRVVFPNILLPDSTSNEVGSHGFFSFRIQPKLDTPFGTIIQNFADIFFDFNPPIRTSTVYHQIRKPVYSDSERLTLCQGELVAGQVIVNDTIIREAFSFASYDSIHFYYIKALESYEESFFIELPEPGNWQGTTINQDTAFTQFLTAANGCDSLVHIQIDVLTSSHELDRALTLQLHPNPAQNYTTITWQADATLRSWQLLNPLGQLIRQDYSETPAGSLKLDTSTLPPGSYEILLEFEAGRVLRRLQIVR